MDAQQLITGIRAKYPTYNDISDGELAARVAQRYPGAYPELADYAQKAKTIGGMGAEAAIRGGGTVAGLVADWMKQAPEAPPQANQPATMFGDRGPGTALLAPVPGADTRIGPATPGYDMTAFAPSGLPTIDDAVRLAAATGDVQLLKHVAPQLIERQRKNSPDYTFLGSSVLGQAGKAAFYDAMNRLHSAGVAGEGVPWQLKGGPQEEYQNYLASLPADQRTALYAELENILSGAGAGPFTAIKRAEDMGNGNPAEQLVYGAENLGKNVFANPGQVALMGVGPLGAAFRAGNVARGGLATAEQIDSLNRVRSLLQLAGRGAGTAANAYVLGQGLGGIPEAVESGHFWQYAPNLLLAGAGGLGLYHDVAGLPEAVANVRGRGPVADALSNRPLSPIQAGDLKADWKGLSQEFHPDKLGDLTPEAQQAIGDIMSQVNAAYEPIRQGKPADYHEVAGVFAGARAEAERIRQMGGVVSPETTPSSAAPTEGSRSGKTADVSSPSAVETSSSPSSTLPAPLEAGSLAPGVSPKTTKPPLTQGPANVTNQPGGPSPSLPVVQPGEGVVLPQAAPTDPEIGSRLSLSVTFKGKPYKGVFEFIGRDEQGNARVRSVANPQLIGTIPEEQFHAGVAARIRSQGVPYEEGDIETEGGVVSPPQAAPYSAPNAAAAAEPRQILASTGDTAGMRAEKHILRLEDYPPEAVQQYVDKYYQAKRYSGLAGKDNVFVVVPSTSGMNSIPEMFAHRLAGDYGGEVVTDYATPTAQLEAKSKRTFAAKLAEPVQFHATQDLSGLAGKNVVVVDDLVNTGESDAAVRRLLASQGIVSTTTAALGALDTRLPGTKDIARLTQRLSEQLGVDYNETLPLVKETFAQSPKQWLNYAEREVTRGEEHARSVYDYVRRSALPADAAGAQGLQRPGGVGTAAPATEVRPAGVPGVLSVAEPPADVARAEPSGVAPPEAAPPSLDAAARSVDPGEQPGPGPEALYSAIVTPGMVKAVSRELADAVTSTVGTAKKLRFEIQRVLNPAAVSAESKIAMRSLREHLAAYVMEGDRLQKAMAVARKSMNNWDHAMVVQFIDDWEHERAQPSAELQALADGMNAVIEEWRDRVVALKTGVLQELIKGYFPHIWKRPDAGAQMMADWLAGKRPLEGTKAFSKKRTIPTFRDGIQAGLEPVSWNPVDLMMMRVGEMMKYVMAHDIINDLAAKKLRKFVRATKPLPAGWSKLDDKYSSVYGGVTSDGMLQLRGYYLFPDAVADILNNHLRAGLQGRAWFDVLTGANNLVTGIQLFGGFHLLMTTFDAYIGKMAIAAYELERGNLKMAARRAAEFPVTPIVNMWQGSKFMRAWYHSPQNAHMAEILDKALAGGARAHPGQLHQLGAWEKMLRAFEQQKFIKGALLSPFAVLDALVMKPLFTAYIPRLKAAALMDMAAAESDRLQGKSRDEVREAMAKVVDMVDNRLGMIIHDNLGWNHILRDLLHLGVRSVGWNLGTEQVGLRPVQDLLTTRARVGKGEMPVSLSQMYLFSLIVFTGMMGAIYMWLRTGKRPEESRDYFQPRTGEEYDDGTPKRVNLPTYVKDAYGYADHPFVTLSHKTSAVVNMATEIWNNEDFYGKPVRTSAFLDHGKPQSEPWKEIEGYLGRQFEPFGMKNYLFRKEQGETGPANLLESMFGITPARTKELSPVEEMRKKGLRYLMQAKELEDKQFDSAVR